MVDTKLLTFVKLYETKSFTKTAEQLYITQPSVTNHIKSLEKNHNIKLFVSNDKNLELTEQGKILYDYAMQLIAFEEGFERLLEASKIGSPRVAFAVTPGAMNGFMKDLLPEWTKRNPQIDFRLEELDYAEIEKAIIEGKFDFAVIDNNTTKRSLTTTALHKTRLILAVGKSHHLALKKKLCFKDLKNEKFYIGTKKSGKRLFFENELHFRNCDIKEITHLNELNDPNIITQIVINGSGISVFYESEIDSEIKNGKLIPIELIEIKNPIEFKILHNKNHIALNTINKIANDFTTIYKEISYLKYSSNF